MKKIYIGTRVLALLMCIVTLFNCSDENYIEEQNQFAETSKNESVDPRIVALYSTHHVMSEEQAKRLAMNAETFFSGKNNVLKSASVDNVIVLKKRIQKNGLKSLEGKSVIPDTTAYIINFADNNGFVVIGADDRIGDPILAYIENGNYDNNQDANQQKIIDGIQQYIENSIVSFELSKDSLMLVAEGYARNNSMVKEDKSSLKSKSSIITYMGDKEVQPLCKTKWGQSSPYNAYIAREKGADYPVGCGSVATAQIMAYWQVASPLSWKEILKGPKITDLTETGKQHLQVLLLFVADGCKSIYGLDGTSTNMTNCAAYLRKSNLKTEIKDYSISSVKSALDSKYPIIIRGTNINSKEKGGHAWVLDGYKSSLYKINMSSISIAVSVDHFHYNWGWNGFCDGWYKSGVFAVNDYETRDDVNDRFGVNGDPDYSQDQKILIAHK